VPTRYYTSGSATVALRVGGSGTNGSLTWLTADGQDSSQIAVNAATGATTEQRYLPFGAQRGTQGPPAGTQDGYLGQPYDPGSDLVQDGARFYDPGLGRFLSPDSVLIPSDPRDLNSYSYGYNSPETDTDSTGLYVLGPGGSPACPSGIPGHCDSNYSPDPNGGNNTGAGGHHKHGGSGPSAGNNPKKCGPPLLVPCVPGTTNTPEKCGLQFKDGTCFGYIGPPTGQWIEPDNANNTQWVWCSTAGTCVVPSGSIGECQAFMKCVSTGGTLQCDYGSVCSTAQPSAKSHKTFWQVTELVVNIGAGVVVGVGVAVGCTALTAGAGAVPCAYGAALAGGATTEGLQAANGHWD
jgi:RHS repeat-associated protein